MRTLTKELRDKLTPDAALEVLKKGNERFVNNLKVHRNLLEQINETADGQYPFAVILSCMDSRTSAELIFDQGLGDIFSIRIAGNILNEDILGSLEFATKVAGSKIILVLGHTKCGAIISACNNVRIGHLTKLLDKLGPVIEIETETKIQRDGSNSSFVYNVTKINVQMTIEKIRKQSPIISELLKGVEIKLLGGIYDVDTGIVEFFEDKAGIGG
ncbi:MAG: carbonic anhydrase family protein [Ignavibacteriaceae bacterium]|jgi:carbonic anhydrase|nr:carbonic anhydrase family protein [Ignavibacteriaceae bacterium]MCW8813033.1 carbonic anhydrase family protein [Chlorobium sp.]MCW8822836.1 carbonic anhydrase family protein [Ignavibacteriaceae bacterium]MCW9095830.1 carbonic anhydrase family protein [Ignavibacteriaceae bacterium]